MKHTVLALGPSIAGFGRLPVLTFSPLGGADLVAVIAIWKHICFQSATLFLKNFCGAQNSVF
jgi:hypothetical protein